MVLSLRGSTLLLFGHQGWYVSLSHLGTRVRGQIAAILEAVSRLFFIKSGLDKDKMVVCEVNIEKLSF